jgi:hypothetical protein
VGSRIRRGEVGGERRIKEEVSGDRVTYFDALKTLEVASKYRW